MHYINNGADGIMIHTPVELIKRNSLDKLSVSGEFIGLKNRPPLVVVPSRFLAAIKLRMN